jgi:hypothetical protein
MHSHSYSPDSWPIVGPWFGLTAAAPRRLKQGLCQQATPCGSKAEIPFKTASYLIREKRRRPANMSSACRCLRTKRRRRQSSCCLLWRLSCRGRPTTVSVDDNSCSKTGIARNGAPAAQQSEGRRRCDARPLCDRVNGTGSASPPLLHIT